MPDKMKKTIAFTLVFCFAFTFSLSIFSNDSKIYYNYKYCDGEMKIALTFDDGPHPKKTPQILDVLSQYGIHATFFAIGQNIEYYPEVAKRILSDGHEIGNHTFSHPNLNRTQKALLSKEMFECENTFKQILNYKSNLFRPPEGVVDEYIRTLASDMGYDVILWSVDTRDWAGTSTEKIVSGILENIEPGDIILMHDYTGKNCHTIEALKSIIPKLIEKGYTFVTVSELISK